MKVMLNNQQLADAVRLWVEQELQPRLGNVIVTAVTLQSVSLPRHHPHAYEFRAIAEIVQAQEAAPEVLSE